MNSDLNPSPESSNSTASDQPQTNLEATTQPENAYITPTETAQDENFPNRQQPIPPPSEPTQYRAIGLVRGRYIASDEQFTQGKLLTGDGCEINSVLLGRIMSLVKNHLDLEQEHLWVVYPRIGQENGELHLQIVGVWEPENLAKQQTPEDLEEQTSEAEEATATPIPSSEIEDGYFSIRGEVVYQSAEAQKLVVKIKQAARKPADKAKYFKLKLDGMLPTKAVGQFWDFQVQREADQLVLQQGEKIADLPRKPKLKKSFQKKPRPSQYGPKRNGDTQRPVRKTGDSSVAKRPGAPKAPLPKPVKREKPPQ